MGWLDKILGREKHVEGLHENEATEEEHERHLEQSANPGSAPPVAPDPGHGSADEVEEAREEPRNAEKTDETRLRDDQEDPLTRESPQSY